MVSIFVAAKCEEQIRRTKHILNVFYYIVQKRSKTNHKKLDKENGSDSTTSDNAEQKFLDPSSPSYYATKMALHNTETMMLRQFGFVLHVEHPHKFVLMYLNILHGTEELAQQAWNILNDRYGERIESAFNGYLTIVYIIIVFVPLYM